MGAGLLRRIVQHRHWVRIGSGRWIAGVIANFSTRARLFIACVVAAGAITLCVALYDAKAHPPIGVQWLSFFLFLTAVALADYYRVMIPQGKASVGRASHGVGGIPYLASLTVLPLPQAILVSAFGMLITEIAKRKHPVKATFNTSVTILTVGLSGLPLSLLGGPSAYFSPGKISVPSLFLLVQMVVCAYLVNTSLMTVLLAMLDSRRIWYTWRLAFRSVVVPELASNSMGIVTGVFWNLYPPLALLLILPVVIIYVSLSHIRRLETETVSSVLTLAELVDARDPYTHGHGIRVGNMARSIAKSLLLPDDLVDIIYLGGRLHDVGKLLVPDQILNKQGALTSDEMQQMQQHPTLGVEMLRHYSEFRYSLGAVRHHHERYDGKGYPDCLAAEDIPLPARIIGLVDAYDAMTSDRPYRNGMAPAEALRRITEQAGFQFDPDLTLHFMTYAKQHLLPAQEIVLTVPDSGGSLSTATGVAQPLAHLVPPSRNLQLITFEHPTDHADPQSEGPEPRSARS